MNINDIGILQNPDGGSIDRYIGSIATLIDKIQAGQHFFSDLEGHVCADTTMFVVLPHPTDMPPNRFLFIWPHQIRPTSDPDQEEEKDEELTLEM